MNIDIRELSIDETAIVAGGDKSTGSASLDKSIDKAKIAAADLAAQINAVLAGIK